VWFHVPHDQQEKKLCVPLDKITIAWQAKVQLQMHLKKKQKKGKASGVTSHKSRTIKCFSFVFNMSNLSRKKAHRFVDEHK